MKSVSKILTIGLTLIGLCVLWIAFSGGFDDTYSEVVQSVTDGEKDQAGNSTRKAINGKTLATDENGDPIQNSNGEYLVESKEEETSTVIIQESVVLENVDQSTEDSSSEFTYTGSDGTIFNSIEDLQQWIYDNDRSISSFEEVYEMNTDELIKRFEERLDIESDREIYDESNDVYDPYTDYGQEGFWDDYDGDGFWEGYVIDSVNDYRDWFRNAEEGDIVTIISSANACVNNVFGNNEQLVISLFDDMNNYVYFHLDPVDGNIPNVLKGDKIEELVMIYSGIRSEENGNLLFYCDSIKLK